MILHHLHQSTSVWHLGKKMTKNTDKPYRIGSEAFSTGYLQKTPNASKALFYSVLISKQPLIDPPRVNLIVPPLFIRSVPMGSRIALIFTAVLMLCGVVAILYAQSNGKRATPSGRIYLKTQTLVGKTVVKVEEGADGRKIHHYVYRVVAKPTEKNMPRYTVDPLYSVTYKLENFQKDDSIKLRPSNKETKTDSPIWIYDVIYVGSGIRSVVFDTEGDIFAPTFVVANSEEECWCCKKEPNECECDFCEIEDVCCKTCNHSSSCSCICHQCKPSVPCTCPKRDVNNNEEPCPGSNGHSCRYCNPCEKEANDGFGVCWESCTGCSCKHHCKCDDVDL